MGGGIKGQSEEMVNLLFLLRCSFVLMRFGMRAIFIQLPTFLSHTDTYHGVVVYRPFGYIHIFSITSHHISEQNTCIPEQAHTHATFKRNGFRFVKHVTWLFSSFSLAMLLLNCNCHNSKWHSNVSCNRTTPDIYILRDNKLLAQRQQPKKTKRLPACLPP